MEFETVLLIASITFAAMASPGPDMFLILKYSSSDSPFPAIACIVGICCGLAVHVLFSLIGIAAIIVASAEIYATLKFVGAGYLIYVGIQMLRSGNGDSSVPAERVVVRSAGRAFREGLFCNLLNPKVTIFILAVFTQVIHSRSSLVDKCGYGALILIEVFVVWNIFALITRTHLIRDFIHRFQTLFDRISGTILALFGVTLLSNEG